MPRKDIPVTGKIPPGVLNKAAVSANPTLAATIVGILAGQDPNSAATVAADAASANPALAAAVFVAAATAARPSADHRGSRHRRRAAALAGHHRGGGESCPGRPAAAATAPASTATGEPKLTHPPLLLPRDREQPPVVNSYGRIVLLRLPAPYMFLVFFDSSSAKLPPPAGVRPMKRSSPTNRQTGSDERRRSARLYRPGRLGRLLPRAFQAPRDDKSTTALRSMGSSPRIWASTGKA